MRSIMENAAEYTIDVPELISGDPKVTIEISAVGGGTVGQFYAGNRWEYAVRCDGEVVITGDDLHSAPALASTHAEMAVVLAGFLGAFAESKSELAEMCWQARAFLEAEGERLSVWNADAEEAAEELADA